MSKSEFKEKANDAVKSVAKTAKFMTLISKKRMEITLIRKEINRNYAKLGKVYYKDYITDEDPDDAEYVPLCEEISDCFRRINALKREIKELNDEFFDRKTESPDDVELVAIEPVCEEDIFEEEPTEE